MIELTTGVVFLMSSMYGGGYTANNQAEKVTPTMTNQTAAVVQSVDSDRSTFKNIRDPKVMETYLREEYADTPILVDIARCESNFRQYDENGDIIRGRVDRNDLGVMQINEHYQGDTAKKLGLDIYTVEGNIAYAKHLYEEQGTQPWISSSKCWSSKAAIANK